MSDHTIGCSGYIVLACGCGERLVLLGHEDDWYVEEHLTFTCGCGAQLTLADRLADHWTLGTSYR
jgi:hypothetical protein